MFCIKGSKQIDGVSTEAFGRPSRAGGSLDIQSKNSGRRTKVSDSCRMAVENDSIATDLAVMKFEPTSKKTIPGHTFSW